MVDIQAVRNAVIEPWSNGQTEGQINRLKALKRAMYGRASVALLCAPMPPSRPGEFHPEPLTDPDMRLSLHPARATQRRLAPSGEKLGSSGLPLTQQRRE